MGLFDEPITYQHVCCNENCKHTFFVTGQQNEKCPECGSDESIFKSVDYNPHSTSDMHGEPKTLGSLAEKNSKIREKRGLSNENPNKRYDKSILKNPEKYIMTGKK